MTGEPLVQRDDDKEETVKARLEHYRRLTHPVLQFFRYLCVCSIIDDKMMDYLAFYLHIY